MTAALEREIRADPDNPEPYVVLGDALLAAGDPHGELIALQNARRQKPGNAALKRREDALLVELAPALLGPLASHAQETRDDRPHVDPRWFMGFMRAVRLEGTDERPLEQLVPLLYALPVARFLRELSFGRPTTEGYEYAPAIAALAKLDAPYPLRTLCYGDDLGDGGHWNRLYELGKLEQLYPRLAKLERLELHGADVDLGSFALPALRELVVDLAGSCRDDRIAQQIARGAAKRLQHLEIDFGPNAPGAVTAKHLAPLFADYPKLTSISLQMIGCGDQIIEAILASKLAKRLERLTLRFAGVTDDAAEMLLAAKLPAALDLSDNDLSPELEEQLAER